MWGEARQRELTTNFFNLALDRGAQLVRHHYTTESAHDIIRCIIKNRPTAIQIRRELVDEVECWNLRFRFSAFRSFRCLPLFAHRFFRVRLIVPAPQYSVLIFDLRGAYTTMISLFYAVPNNTVQCRTRLTSVSFNMDDINNELKEHIRRHHAELKAIQANMLQVLKDKDEETRKEFEAETRKFKGQMDRLKSYSADIDRKSVV